MRPWLFVLPAFILVLFVGILPTLCVFNYSFQKPYAEVNKFVGFDNYRKVLHSDRWWAAFGRNLLFSAIALAIEIPLGLGLALLLYRGGKFNGFVSATITIPALIPWVTIGLIWRLLCRRVGPLATFLNSVLHMNYSPFVNSTHAFWTIVAMDVWHWTSLVFIVCAAALASMDRTPVLAARVEGATRWQIFRYVEMPALTFPLTFVAMMRFMDTFKIYDEPFVLTAGGPGLTTEFLTLYVKRIGLEQWLLGVGSAASLIYLYIVLIFSFVLMLVITRGRGLM